MIRPLQSSLTREDAGRFFDSGALARVPEQVIGSATGPLVNDWERIVKDAQHTIGHLLAPGDGVSYAYEPDLHISLFTNTTSAFTRVLSRIERAYKGSDPTLLTTDLEYPGCLAAIDDAWSGPVVMARVMSRLLDASSTEQDRILRDALIRAHNFVKPRVVFVSHVMRATGQVLSPKTLRTLRESNPRVIIVVDGSQAIGNIVAERELLEEADFYIASGHKWLGGMTTSGFVWRRDPSRWVLADPAQSFDYPGQLGGSGNAAAWSSLVMSLDDMLRERPKRRLEGITRHNRRLGRVFREALEPARSFVDMVTPFHRGMPPSGLVTIGVRPAKAARIVSALEAERYSFTVLDTETVQWRSRMPSRFLLHRDSDYPVISPAPEETATSPKKARADLRFCFHYWHGEDDVRALADAICASAR